MIAQAQSEMERGAVVPVNLTVFVVLVLLVFLVAAVAVWQKRHVPDRDRAFSRSHRIESRR